MSKETGNVINEYHLNRHQPDKPQFAIHDLNSYIKTHRADTTKPHIHSFYQVIWFKQGTGTHFVDFREYEVHKNVIFFITKDQVHYFDDNTRYEGVLIHFNDAFLIQNKKDADLFQKSDLFNNPYQQPFCCIEEDMTSILDGYILQIKRELEYNDAFGKEALLRNYLESFLIQMQRERNESDRNQNGIPLALDEKRVQLIKFIKLMDENYNKGFTVAEYARLLFVSSRTLSDLTRRLLNKAPSQMIQERIILEAQRLLLYTNLNVNQVGYRLGFDDPSYFVKYFRKHTKISPTEFRKSVS